MVAKYHRSRCNATCAALAVKPAPVSALAPTRFRAGAEHRGGWEARPEIAAPPARLVAARGAGMVGRLPIARFLQFHQPGAGCWARSAPAWSALANRPLPAIRRR